MRSRRGRRGNKETGRRGEGREIRVEIGEGKIPQ